MIKIFMKDYKLNFVDSNNVFVGFDYENSCCESFGWFISQTIPNNKTNEEQCEQFEDVSKQYGFNSMTQFDGVFDPDYYKFIKSPDDSNEEFGGVGIFKIIMENGTKLYLGLYNYHNGYYSHGFSMLKNDVVIVEEDV